jgi:hypothetical protein
VLVLGFTVSKLPLPPENLTDEERGWWAADLISRKPPPHDSHKLKTKVGAEPIGARRAPRVDEFEPALGRRKKKSPSMMIPNAAKQTRDHPVKAASKRVPRKHARSTEPIDYEPGALATHQPDLTLHTKLSMNAHLLWVAI